MISVNLCANLCVLCVESGISSAVVADELVVLLAVLVDRLAVVPHAVPVEVGLAEVCCAATVELALTLSILLVTPGRIKSAACACEEQRIVMGQQAQHSERAGSDRYVAPFVLLRL